MRRALQFSARQMRPYAWWYAGGVVLLLATNALSVSIPLYLAAGLDALVVGDRASALNQAAAVVAMSLAVIIVRTGSRLLFFTPGRLVEANLKRALFQRLLHLQADFFDRYATGDLVSRANADVGTVRLLAGFTLLGLTNTAVAVAFAGAQMARLSGIFALLLLPPLLLGMAVTLWSVQRLLVIQRELQAQVAALSDTALSTFQGASAIRAFAAQPAFAERFDRMGEQWVETSERLARLRVGIGPTLGLAAAFDVFLILWLGGAKVSEGQLSVGELVAMTTLVAYLTGPLRGLSFILSLFRQAAASIERLEEVLEAPIDRPDQSPVKRLPAPRPPEVRVTDLSWSPPGSDRVILDQVSFTLPAGKTLGVFGATGAGKSTLFDLLLRVRNPPPNTLFIDGTDVRHLDLERWRAVSTYVPQRPFLFSERIAANVLLDQTDPSVLSRATRQAALEPDLAALPEGLDTRVGEAGVLLSGGQRQRVALARGLARRSPLLVLDDVLAAVDQKTEAELLQTLAELDPRPTLILASHRLSALLQADLVLVLEEGRLVSFGPPSEVLAQPGPLREAWLSEQRSAPGASA